MDPVLELLKVEVYKLKQLLDDPQPGLATWNWFVAERWQNIINLRKAGNKGKK